MVDGIRVLIVDDSIVIREMIADCIEASPGMTVVGKASSGLNAVRMVEQYKPDVVTLDIQMPGMDGLETLDAILSKRPIPVIMVSALTQLGASVTFEALDRGAVDYIPKPENGSQAKRVLGEDLIRKIRTMAGTDVERLLRIRKDRQLRTEKRKEVQVEQARPSTPGKLQDSARYLKDKCIALGISTGGPPALGVLFESLQPPMPPIVVVQHMPPDFTKSLAWRLDSLSQLSVKEAETDEVLEPNQVYIAPGGFQLHLMKSGNSARIKIKDGPQVSGHKPSVDVMMGDVASIFGSRCMGIVMTGMGRDGSDGCGAIRAAGGYVLGQDQETSDVYGMNKVAFVEGNVDAQFGLNEAANLVTRQVCRLWRLASQPA